MAWNPEYTTEFNALMKKWVMKYRRNLRKKLQQEAWQQEAEERQTLLTRNIKLFLQNLKKSTEWLNFYERS